LGLLGREEDGRALLASVPEEWQKLDPTVPMYHVANELVRVRKTAPRLGIWAWKWGASMRRPADRAFICNHILCACLRLPEEERPDAIRLEVIPLVESALAEPESEGLGWDNTLPDLILAYGLTDDAEKATERGAFWLRDAARRGISADDLPRTRLRLAQMLECVGRQAEAAVMLRDLADHPSQRAREDARTALGALIERHPEVQRQ